jgi:hypothetical protein
MMDFGFVTMHLILGTVVAMTGLHMVNSDDAVEIFDLKKGVLHLVVQYYYDVIALHHDKEMENSVEIDLDMTFDLMGFEHERTAIYSSETDAFLPRAVLKEDYETACSI